MNHPVIFLSLTYKTNAHATGMHYQSSLRQQVLVLYHFYQKGLLESTRNWKSLIVVLNLLSFKQEGLTWNQLLKYAWYCTYCML